MDQKQVQMIVDRYVDIFLYGSKGVLDLMSEQLFEQLSFMQYSLLRILYEKEPLRMSELAGLLGIHKSAVTVKVEKLEKKGLIERERDRQDRRNIYLYVSPKGKKQYEETEEKIAQFLTDIMQQLSPEEMEAFLDGYVKIASAIKRYGEEKK
ncbi:MarR family transcriptional regulator [Paenibacillus larvae]|uniref:Transcriptional regulator-like protein n=4 Tax=Paenibacillus larvae TaxID=1464 RepID=V9W2I7_9BACL|nr:MarR family transcriptional regulator [Paenibacillus larvae]AHD04323.1 transcriptional regulator-like protein [Paenibacillus larvae subsp. larvae DSM 25430]AQR78438.1 MarR family transcriptional regulator [Paenibacillus larvae subsp. larvae]AQT84699.1 MarR family transcriptional regulator [Paenibacillus larvae subsp. pulvifaciens]AQZ46698.1 MarR family transcriptional regulator [Paenibacillus larvae subsp. pulvifaciens]ARF68106.1 MarR family transcriptional regulator [Paenibacillus larvae s